MSHELSTENQGGGNRRAGIDGFLDEAPQAPIGNFLRFDKFGVFRYGKEGHALLTGTALGAIVPSFYVGYKMWKDNKPIAEKMGFPFAGYNMPLRVDLGDNDPALWPIDPITSKPKDPWQETYSMVLINPTVPDEIFTFNSSSRGGMNALTGLARSYRRRRPENTFRLPVVELGSDEYAHKEKALGMIKFPTFTILSWIEAKVFEEVFDRFDSNVALPPSSAPATAPMIAGPKPGPAPVVSSGFNRYAELKGKPQPERQPGEDFEPDAEIPF